MVCAFRSPCQLPEVKLAMKKLLSLATGCVVLGSPSYYQRFGFQHHPQLSYPDGPASHFMAKAFIGTVPAAEVRYHASFYGEPSSR